MTFDALYMLSSYVLVDDNNLNIVHRTRGMLEELKTRNFDFKALGQLLASTLIPEMEDRVKSDIVYTIAGRNAIAKRSDQGRPFFHTLHCGGLGCGGNPRRFGDLAESHGKDFREALLTVGKALCDKFYGSDDSHHTSSTNMFAKFECAACQKEGRNDAMLNLQGDAVLLDRLPNGSLEDWRV